MDVTNFFDIEGAFQERVSRIVWCTVATVDRRGRPRTRILHPIWLGSTGWVLTGRQGLKSEHLARNPYVSLLYWDPQQEIVTAECKAEWDDAAEAKRHIWQSFQAAAPPLGYDPGMIWKDGDDPSLGLLRLTPSRIEVALPSPRGLDRLTWRAPHSDPH